MNRKTHLSRIPATVLAAAICLWTGMSACRPANDSSSEARKDYARSLDDSIASLKMKLDSCDQAVKRLKEQEDVWLRDFTTVANSREAAPYIIYSDMKAAYPPKATALLARLAENGQFELVAALRGNRFDRITVTAGDSSIDSETVPPDQALNYTADGLTTVLFTGPRADSIGQLIADNDLNDVKVIFSNGRPIGAIQLSNEYKKMIMASYQLYAARRDCNRMERTIPLLSRKIDILRDHKEKDSTRP